MHMRVAAMPALRLRIARAGGMRMPVRSHGLEQAEGQQYGNRYRLTTQKEHLERLPREPVRPPMNLVAAYEFD